MSEERGPFRAKTVLGPINPDQLGITSMHEHFQAQFIFKRSVRETIGFGF